MIRIDFINFLTALVWRLINLLSSLILAGFCFVFFLFMAVYIIVIIFRVKNHDFWQNKPGNESEEWQN